MLIHNYVFVVYTLQIIKIYTSVIPSNSCQIFQLFQFEQQLDKKQWIIVTNAFSIYIIILNILGMEIALGLSLSVQNMDLCSIWYLFPWTVSSESTLMKYYSTIFLLGYRNTLLLFFFKYTFPPDLILSND